MLEGLVSGSGGDGSTERTDQQVCFVGRETFADFVAHFAAQYEEFLAKGWRQRPVRCGRNSMPSSASWESAAARRFASVRKAMAGA